jgi:hypothetical protein
VGAQGEVHRLLEGELRACPTRLMPATLAKSRASRPEEAVIELRHDIRVLDRPAGLHRPEVHPSILT